MGTKRNPAGQDIATPSKPVRKPPKSIVLTTDKFRALVEADARTLPALTSVPAVPSGHGLEDGKLLTCEQFAGAISVLWRQADQAFVGIGRLLNSAKERLEHGHFMRLVSQEVPFTHGTANKLMRVAASIDCGRLPEDRLPRRFSAAAGEPIGVVRLVTAGGSSSVLDAAAEELTLIAGQKAMINRAKRSIAATASGTIGR